jgi:ABC-type transport system involved in multi-copper enzyme maturation permease subunit
LSPAAEIRILVAREMRRSVRSVKGIVLGVLTLLGAIVTSRVCMSIEDKERLAANATSTEQFIAIKRQLIEQQTGNAAFAAYTASLPASLLVFLEITIWLGPLLVALLGFDAISGELQHRSVRFWTVRTRRGSYFAGKLFGLWAVVGLITLAINVVANGFALAKGFVTAGQVVSWGVRFWLIAFLIAGAWAAIATFISSCFKTPILSLLTTFGTFFVLWLFGIVGFLSRFAGDGSEARALERMRWYEYVYPNAYDSMLLSPEAGKVFLGLAILLGFVALVTAGGALLFQSKDI